MLKLYFQLDSQPDELNTLVCAVSVGSVKNEDMCLPAVGVTRTWENNSKAWAEVSAKLKHLLEKEQEKFLHPLNPIKGQ